MLTLFNLAFAQAFAADSETKPLDQTIIEKDSSNMTNMNTPEYVILRASEQATFSSETSASVANLYIKEGSHFSVGDILLSLDCRVQEADLRKALAQQEATQSAIESAKKLKQYDAISEFELTKAASDAEMANADVAKLKAIVDKCIIKAPFNGSVAELMVYQHETVKSGDPLLKIVGTENLELELQVPSNWLQWLHVGYQFDVHIHELNKAVAAKVVRINPQIEPVSQTVKIVGVISQPDDNLLPGMTGQAIFPDGKK